MQQKQELNSKDLILLTGMEFLGRHGCSEEERKHLQPFIVDAELSLDLSKAGNSDDLTDTVDYVQVFDEVKRIVTGTPKNLIEAVAEDIAQSLLKNFEQIESLKITIHKPAALPSVGRACQLRQATRYNKGRRPLSKNADIFNGAAISIIRSRAETSGK